MTWSTVFVLLFVTLGPIRPTMAFFAMTRSAAPSLRRRIAIRGVGVAALVLVFLLNADRILAKVPPIVLKIVVRVLGVLLAAMAVQFMIFGSDGLGLMPNS